MYMTITTGTSRPCTDWRNKLEILFHWNRCVTWHCIETCIPSLEWFGPTVTKLCSVQGNPDAATADKSNTKTCNASKYI